MNYKICSVVLAAGSSRRMELGNKLMLKIKNKTILSQTIENILYSDFSYSIVITGHQNKIIKKLLNEYEVYSYYNPKYKEGISTSIAVGINYLKPYTDGVMICLSDMPGITKNTYNLLIEAFNNKYEKNKPLIVIPEYNKKKGNPILFSKHFFSKLKNLKGDIGAKNLIKKNNEHILNIKINEETIFTDIDTAEAYEKFKKN